MMPIVIMSDVDIAFQKMDTSTMLILHCLHWLVSSLPSVINVSKLSVHSSLLFHYFPSSDTRLMHKTVE